jgi:hypothetical protein
MVLRIVLLVVTSVGVVVTVSVRPLVMSQMKMIGVIMTCLVMVDMSHGIA